MPHLPPWPGMGRAGWLLAVAAGVVVHVQVQGVCVPYTRRREARAQTLDGYSLSPLGGGWAGPSRVRTARQ
jgi:hypothetical protein